MNVENSMQTETQLNGKTLSVSLSQAASQALAQRSSPLLVEMELYFSCLIRKRVLVRDAAGETDAVSVNDKLSLRFHPVMSQHCEVDENLDGPPLTDFPIVHGERFSPSWLQIDYRNGQWSGEFGY